MAAGESVSVFGPNGAGKSTLLRVLAGLMRPTSGRVWIGGQPLEDGAVGWRARLGFLSHHSFLYESLTAYENLLFYAHLYGIPDPARRVSELLERVGLTLFRDDPVRTYSRGMQQRLAIARAILHDPQVLLLDEPFTGLDQQGAAMLHEMLAGWAAGGDRAVLLVSHHLEEGLAHCHRAVILARGTVVGEAAGEQLRHDRFAELYRKAIEGEGRR